MLSLFLKLVHELFIFLGFVTSIGSSLVLWRVARSGKVSTIAEVFTFTRPIRNFIPVAYGVGSLLGLVTAIVEQDNLLAPWLIATYVLVIALAFLGERFTGKWHNKVAQLATSLGEGSATPELQGLLKSTRERTLFWVDVIAITVIVVLMVFKPFS